MKNLVSSLLRRNISALQMTGYALASLVGLAIVVTAVRFYSDVRSLWADDDSFMSRDYLIISKTVSGLGALMGANTSFSTADIAEIESQPWAGDVGGFRAADFNVYATVSMGGKGMSTALFLESIPQEFFDINPKGWSFRPGVDTTVPIVISKDYLTLYNFGFATSRGLPQISEGMIGAIPLRLSLSGNGQQRWMDAKIVGFSSRLNTIAVPEEFMEWANGIYGEPGSTTAPSRLIIKVKTPGDPAIATFLASKGYEAAGDKADNGRAAFFLRLVTGIVLAVGVVICALAFFILMLSVWLLLTKSRDKLRQLMLLGYSPQSIARCYYLIIGTINLAVLGGALAIMFIVRHCWKGSLESLGIEPGSCLSAIGAGIIIMALITAGNFLAIRHRLRSDFFV